MTAKRARNNTNPGYRPYTFCHSRVFRNKHVLQYRAIFDTAVAGLSYYSIRANVGVLGSALTCFEDGVGGANTASTGAGYSCILEREGDYNRYQVIYQSLRLTYMPKVGATNGANAQYKIIAIIHSSLAPLTYPTVGTIHDEMLEWPGRKVKYYTPNTLKPITMKLKASTKRLYPGEGISDRSAQKNVAPALNGSYLEIGIFNTNLATDACSGQVDVTHTVYAKWFQREKHG